MSNLEPREELASIAASLRAYLEWQQDCGSSGIPRRAREARAVDVRGTAVSMGDPVTITEPTHPPTPLSLGVPSSVVKDPSPPNRLPDLPSGERTPGSLPPISIPDFAPESGAPSRSKRTSSPPPPMPPSVGTPRALPVLMADVKACVQCGLHATRTNTVFARGSIEAKLCFIGEAPGADEDAQGLPFVGRAGQLLDRMIHAMGLDPERDVYVCNIIKCRPPGNRKPEPEETAKCIPFLHEQLAHMKPKVIVALGNTAVASLLGTKLGITKVRGSWKLYRGAIPVMPTYHPSYLLRPGPAQSEAKRQVWEDLQTVMKELGLKAPSPASRA